ncbi:MAG: hypothetical protein RJA81_2045 [Planctomycetota bacterium]
MSTIVNIPAIIYGHKQAAQPVSLTRESVATIIKRGSHVIALEIDGNTETVLVRDLQWDHLGKEILHIDFFRADLTELIDSDVRLEIRGEAPGVKEGGVLDVTHHSIKVQSRTDNLPDSIRVDVSELHMGQSIHVKDLVLPEGVTALTPGDEVLIHLIRPTGASAAESEETATEPERITRPEKKSDE